MTMDPSPRRRFLRRRAARAAARSLAACRSLNFLRLFTGELVGASMIGGLLSSSSALSTRMVFRHESSPWLVGREGAPQRVRCVRTAAAKPPTSRAGVAAQAARSACVENCGGWNNDETTPRGRRRARARMRRDKPLPEAVRRTPAIPANAGEREDRGGRGRGALATAGAGAPRRERGRPGTRNGHLTRRGIGACQECLRHEATEHNGGQDDRHPEARTQRHDLNSRGVVSEYVVTPGHGRHTAPPGPLQGLGCPYACSLVGS